MKLLVTEETYDVDYLWIQGETVWPEGRPGYSPCYVWVEAIQRTVSFALWTSVIKEMRDGAFVGSGVQTQIQERIKIENEERG